MEDPLPENISGQKRVTHSVNHNVNWSHVVIALAVLVALLKFGPPLLGSSSDDVDEASEEIEASGEWAEIELGA